MFSILMTSLTDIAMRSLTQVAFCVGGSFRSFIFLPTNGLQPRSQDRSSTRPLSRLKGKIRDPGNEVDLLRLERNLSATK